MEERFDEVERDAEGYMKDEAKEAYDDAMLEWKGDEFSKPTFDEWIAEVSSRLNDE